MQWRARRRGSFEPEGLTYGVADAALVRHILAVSGDLAPTSWILDCGCGDGGKLAAAASARPDLRFLGLDRHADLPAVAHTCRDLPNVHVVRGDARTLPLRSSSMASAWCLGVLHHLADQPTAARELLRVLLPESWLTLWLYPVPGDLEHPRVRLAFELYYAVRDLVFLGRGHRLPRGVRYSATAGLAWLLAGPYEALFFRRVRSVKRSFEGAWQRPLAGAELRRHLHFLFHDDLVPELQTRWSRAEVRTLFGKLGTSKVRAWQTAAELELLRLPGFYLVQR